MHVNIRRVERGSTLIEVLVSVLVLTVGVVGMLGGHGNSVVLQRKAGHLTTATALAQGLADLGRSNRAAARSGGLQWTQAYQSGSEVTLSGCSPLVCTPQEAGRQRLSEWLKEVRSSLPEGDAFVRSDADGNLDIWVMWRDTQAAGRVSSTAACDPQPIQHLAEELQPNCVYVKARI